MVEKIIVEVAWKYVYNLGPFKFSKTKRYYSTEVEFDNEAWELFNSTLCHILDKRKNSYPLNAPH